MFLEARGMKAVGKGRSKLNLLIIISHNVKIILNYEFY